MKNLSRRDFGKSLTAGAVALSLAVPGVAGAALNDQGAGYDFLTGQPFASFRFGEPQLSQLVCTKGACLQARSKFNYSRYKLPVDISFFEGIEIGTPTYDYYNNQLVRISFSVLEKGRKSAEALNAAIAVLKDVYGIALVKKKHAVVSSDQEVMLDRYVTDQAYVVDLDRRRYGKDWTEVSVKIFDKNLIDAFCFDVNPDYMPKDLL